MRDGGKRSFVWESMKIVNGAPIHEAIRPAKRRTARAAFPLSGRKWKPLRAVLATALAFSAQTPAQDPVPASLGPGDPAWLAYRPVRPGAVFGSESGIPDTIVMLGNDALEQSAARELAAGWQGMLHRVPRIREDADPRAPGAAETLVVVGTQAEMRRWRPELAAGAALGADAYRLHRAGKILLIEGGDARGALYGAFALLREIAEEHSLLALDEHSEPWAAVRWTNEWDNPDGTIERGYAGPSIFFENGHVRADLKRAASYARLLASVGIDGCTINNVNADARLLQPENLKEIARIADVFRPYGVRLSLSIDMSSPVKDRRPRHFRSARSAGCRMVAGKGQRDLQSDSRFWRRGRQGRFGGPAGTVAIRAQPADAANVLARALASRMAGWCSTADSSTTTISTGAKVEGEENRRKGPGAGFGCQGDHLPPWFSAGSGEEDPLQVGGLAAPGWPCSRRSCS